MTVENVKHHLRAEMLAKLKLITPPQRTQAGVEVAEHLRPWLESMKSSLSGKGVAFFVSFSTEIDTHPIDTMLVELQLRRFLPTWDVTNSELCFREILSSQQSPKKVEIREIGVLLVTGLAFDKAGRRLGRGKGIYDRFLAKCRENKERPIFVGIGLSDQLVDVPVESHDQTVDWLCLPSIGFIRALS